MLLGLGCAQPQAAARSDVVLDGRVTWAGAGARDASAWLLPTDEPPASATKSALVTRTGSDGSFRVAAPPGTYILVARQGTRFSFYGRNPLQLHASVRGLTLPLLEGHGALWSPAAAEKEQVSGRVFRAGKPVEGARVTAYLDLATGLRGPGYASSDLTGADGSYVLALSPGTYFLAARTRLSGADSGPLGPGDSFGAASEFPLALGAGRSARLDIELLELPSREKRARTRASPTLLFGDTVDEAGRPAAGMRVCLYNNNRFLNQPLVVSDPTGPDGRFSIETSLTGTLYLGARERLGGPPGPGERVGFLTGVPEGRVDLSPGDEFRNLRLRVQVVQ